jgi:conserved oligomeric Golgi complex subunit 8
VSPIIWLGSFFNVFAAHKRNRKTLKHNMQLIELLEIPQLVDACARNGFHDEALDLAAFVNGLERKHIFAAEVRQSSTLTTEQVQNRKGNSVVKSIVNDVHATLADLRRQLLVHLSEDSSLPKLLQTLTSLRRLDGILIDRQLSAATAAGSVEAGSTDEMRSRLMQRVETALQMNFLEARSVWVQAQVETAFSTRHQALSSGLHNQDDATESHSTSISSGTMLGPYGRGIELLEIYRSSWFSVVSQFNALFASSSSEHPSASLLAYWIEDQISVLLSELSDLLRDIEEGPSVRSLLEQCLLFSERMREVGCDFRVHLLPVFEHAIVWRVGSMWSKGLSNFKQMVVTERFVTRGLLDDTEEDEDMRAARGGEQVRYM